MQTKRAFLGIETYCPCRIWGDAKAFAHIKAAGFDCIDYSFYGAAAKWAMRDESRMADAQSIRRMLNRQGLFCHQAHAPFSFQYNDPMAMDTPAYHDIVCAMQAAAVLGAKYIVVHSIPVPMDTDLIEYNLVFLKSLEKYCVQFGIQIGVENLFTRADTGACTELIGTPEKLTNFLEQLDSPWFAACVDLGHAAIVGIKPEDFIRRMGSKWLRLVHIQDTNYADDLHQLPYMGLQNWDAVIQALAEIEFEGDFSFEIFGYLQNIDKKLMPAALSFATAVGTHLIEKLSDLKPRN